MFRVFTPCPVGFPCCFSPINGGEVHWGWSGLLNQKRPLFSFLRFFVCNYSLRYHNYYSLTQWLIQSFSWKKQYLKYLCLFFPSHDVSDQPLFQASIRWEAFKSPGLQKPVGLDLITCKGLLTWEMFPWHVARSVSCRAVLQYSPYHIWWNRRWARNLASGYQTTDNAGIKDTPTAIGLHCRMMFLVPFVFGKRNLLPRLQIPFFLLYVEVRIQSWIIWNRKRVVFAQAIQF